MERKAEMENEVIFTPGGKIWLGEDGIVRSVSTRPQYKLMLAETKEILSAILKVSNGKKRPYCADSSDIRYADRESREYAASEEFAEAITAMAILIGSPVSKIIGNFFLNINKPKFPTRLFISETEAIEWLKGFIE